MSFWHIPLPQSVIRVWLGCHAPALTLWCLLTSIGCWSALCNVVKSHDFLPNMMWPNLVGACDWLYPCWVVSNSVVVALKTSWFMFIILFPHLRVRQMRYLGDKTIPRSHSKLTFSRTAPYPEPKFGVCEAAQTLRHANHERNAGLETSKGLQQYSGRITCWCWVGNREWSMIHYINNDPIPSFPIKRVKLCVVRKLCPQTTKLESSQPKVLYPNAILIAGFIPSTRVLDWDHWPKWVEITSSYIYIHICIYIYIFNYTCICYYCYWWVWSIQEPFFIANVQICVPMYSI